MTLLYEASELHFDYPLGNERVRALRGIDLAVRAGEFVCLAGPSGSGKTTLLHLLGLIEPLQHGSLRFLGQDLAALPEAARNRVRRFQLGFVFQQFHLMPVLSAEENVAYFLARQGLARRERDARVRAALEAVGLWDERGRRPQELSGGQRQRVAIARAIAKRPRVVIADEPTASLDQETGRRTVELLRELNSELGVTLVLSSHDPMVHARVGRLVRLHDGRVVDGPAPMAAAAGGG